jgi:hypothetical protein
MCKFLPRRSKAATAASAPSAPSTSQEDDDWLSAELRDGHTKIPNLELQQDGSRGHSAAKFFSTSFFVSWVRNRSDGMYTSYSVVPKKKVIPVVFVVCFLDWQKKVGSFFLCQWTR